MDFFDIIGPVMIGPSSSHTAGAVRIGLTAREIFGGLPTNSRILLHGSLVKTGRGHGTDRALIGGILGLQTDDIRIPDSFSYAARAGLEFTFGEVELENVHPNTVRIIMNENMPDMLCVTASSVGGGAIRVIEINGEPISFTAEYPTLVVFSVDRAGTVADISHELYMSGINIAFMNVSRRDEGSGAVMVIATDQPVKEEICRRLETKPNIKAVRYIRPFTAQE